MVRLRVVGLGFGGVCMYKPTSRGQRTTFGVVSFWLPFFEIESFIDLELQVAPGTLHLPRVGIISVHHHTQLITEVMGVKLRPLWS